MKAAIFDMDGLLINSEPLWQQAELDIFQKVGVPLTREMCLDTMGLRIDEVVTHWHSRYPWETQTLKSVEQEVVQAVIDLILESGHAMEGVYDILEFLKSKGFKLALASSSHFRLIEAVVTKLKIKEYFSVIHSAEIEEFGKPHPGIFITTARKMNVAPVECMAFEDSFNGLLACRSARMISIAVPDEHHFHQTRFDIAHLKLKSLKNFGVSELEKLKGITT